VKTFTHLPQYDVHLSASHAAQANWWVDFGGEYLDHVLVHVPT